MELSVRLFFAIPDTLFSIVEKNSIISDIFQRYVSKLIIIITFFPSLNDNNSNNNNNNNNITNNNNNFFKKGEFCLLCRVCADAF